MSIGTCRTKECAPAPVVLTGTAVGTDVGLQLSTTGKLDARGEGEPEGVSEGPGLGDEPVVEPAAKAVGCETPLLAGVGELVGLLRLEALGFESPQAAATSRAAMQRQAMAARRKPRIMSSTPPDGYRYTDSATVGPCPALLTEGSGTLLRGQSQASVPSRPEHTRARRAC